MQLLGCLWLVAAALVALPAAAVIHRPPNVCSNCGHPNAGPPPSTTPKPPSCNAQALVARTIRQFGVDLYKKVAEKNRKCNIVVSPVMTGFALASLASGAAGATRRQLARTLHYPGRLAPRCNLKYGYEKILKSISATNHNHTLRMDNHILADKRFRLRKQFIVDQRKYYMMRVGDAPFTRLPEDSQILVNYCIQGFTYGNIIDFLPPRSITKDTTLLLTSALAFRGYWEHPFVAGRTAKAPFYQSAKRYVDMMVPDCGAQYLGYANVRSLCSEVVELPFHNSTVAMYVVLPRKKVRLSYVERKIRWNPDVLGLKRRKVYVVLPKFTIRKKLPLKRILQALGVKNVFNRRRADFRHISSRGGLSLDEVHHQGYIKVDERGTEVTYGSASAKCTVKGSLPKWDSDIMFVANRPFLFFVWDRRTKTVLLSGRFQG